jgi:hypothetical protein
MLLLGFLNRPQVRGWFDGFLSGNNGEATGVGLLFSHLLFGPFPYEHDCDPRDESGHQLSGYVERNWLGSWGNSLPISGGHTLTPTLSIR